MNPDSPIRLLTSIPATVTFSGQTLPTRCSVTEISPSSATLSFAKCECVPQIFWLRLQGDIQLHCATVVWRKQNYLGVEFRCGHDKLWWQHSRVLAAASKPSFSVTEATKSAHLGK